LFFLVENLAIFRADKAFNKEEVNHGYAILEFFWEILEHWSKRSAKWEIFA